MLNETTLLNHLKRRIGSKLFECIDPNEYITVLKEESLMSWSTYYPKIIKGIKVTEANAIPTYDPQNNLQEYHRYRIPKFNPEDEYIGIESYTFIGQYWDQVNTGFGAPLADALWGKVRSLQPVPTVRWSCEFEAPDFVEVYPYRRTHLNFVLNMQRLTRLSEIPAGLQDTFKKLFVLDVKSYIYHEYPAARENGVINGIEIQTDINDFSSAEQDREQLCKDELGNDWFLEPSRFATLNRQGYA
jgi:hypothetical protein